MEAEIAHPESFPIADSSALKFSIIYEDFASGTRARHFAERLAAGLECHCRLSDSLWRCDLLEDPLVAAQAARDAEDCDFLIVSQRGDRVLAAATREWIEARLAGAAHRGMGLVALSASDQGQPRIMDANRGYFRTVCSATGVPFFSHAVTVPAQRPVTTLPDEKAVACEDEVLPWPRMPALGPT